MLPRDASWTWLKSGVDSGCQDESSVDYSIDRDIHARLGHRASGEVIDASQF